MKWLQILQNRELNLANAPVNHKVCNLGLWQLDVDRVDVLSLMDLNKHFDKNKTKILSTLYDTRRRRKDTSFVPS